MQFLGLSLVYQSQKSTMDKFNRKHPTYRSSNLHQIPAYLDAHCNLSLFQSLRPGLPRP